MDARAALALMTKARLVFESSDTFLSFPALSPVSYTPDQMSFLPAAHDISAFADFSRLCDSAPGGVVFQPSMDQTLSKSYLDVLKNAQLARGTLTADQTAQLQQAQAFLQTQGADGFAAPSAAVLAYYQYQQNYIRAVQNYKAQQLTAQSSSDPNAQAQWQNVDQPQLQAQVDAAESDWENKGFKAQVEAAKQVVAACVAQSPSLQWQAWVSDCNPDIDFVTDLSNQQFAPTVYVPYDIIKQDDWPTFSMSSTEIQVLVGQASAELANVVGTAAPDSIVDSLSFEFCSAALSRPWFHSEIFAARFWKFTGTSAPLSDGNVPPHGQLPAYVTAVILARNIVVSTHGAGGNVQKLNLTSFPHIMLLSHPMVVGHPVVAMAGGQAPAHPAPAMAPMPMRVAATAPMLARQPVASQPAAVQPAHPVAIPPIVLLRLNATAFTVRPPATAPQPSTPGGATGAGASSSQPAAGQVSILAFVCKRLPKCPDPDLSLAWG